MNYNPYYFINPSEMTGANLGFSRFLGRGINWGSLLNGAQRALGLINQAIPIMKEAAPVMRNARTMFKVMNEFKKIDAPSNDGEFSSNLSSSSYEDKSYSSNSYSGGPTFFA